MGISTLKNWEWPGDEAMSLPHAAAVAPAASVVHANHDSFCTEIEGLRSILCKLRHVSYFYRYTTQNDCHTRYPPSAYTR